MHRFGKCKFRIWGNYLLRYACFKLIRSMTYKLIWNMIHERDNFLLFLEVGHFVSIMCWSHGSLTLIGLWHERIEIFDLSLIWDMQLQVWWSFDVTTTCASCQCCMIWLDPIVFNGNFVLDFCSVCWCYRKMIFILLISELQQLPCNKNQIDTAISWGQYFSLLILDDS